MNQKARNISNVKQLLLVCFALIALSPCIVKETVYGLTVEDYQKPLNKSRTTVQSFTCQFYQQDNLETTTSKQQNSEAEIAEIVSLSLPNFKIHQPGFNNHYSKTFSGNSPSKYILYKRLKLDIA